MVHLKTCCLRSNRVTRQVSFNWTKICGTCQNSNATYWVIFNHCARRVRNMKILFYGVFSFLFINLTLASTGFVLRPQIQRGKIGWMLAKKVGSERGRRQSPAHSVKRKKKHQKLSKNAIRNYKDFQAHGV